MQSVAFWLIVPLHTTVLVSTLGGDAFGNPNLKIVRHFRKVEMDVWIVDMES